VVEEGVDEQAILAPQQGVARDPRGNAYALVVGAGDKVESRELAIDRAIGNRWRVTSGLAAGDRILVDGLLMVRPGMAITPVPVAEGGATPAPGAAGPAR
jgi:membrane fusion protein (multidrug efflux system)